MQINLLAFRLKFRKEIGQATIEMLKVMKEEINKETERRNKKK